MPPQIPNIYTLGQVQVSTQPLAQLQGQLLAKQQAKEEALDKYYNDLTGKITSAGMHSKDIPGFLKEKEDLAKYWNSNKNEISKGGLAKQEFDARANKIFSHIEQSKGDVKFLYDMRDKEIEDEDMPKLAARGRSIYDPAYYKDPNTLTPYDYSDFTHFVPLPDVAKQNSYWGAITQGFEPKTREYEKDAKGNIIYTPIPDSFGKKAKYKEGYGVDQIKAMADRAASYVSTDEGYKKLYNIPLNDAAKATKQNLPLSPEFVELKKAFDYYYPGGIMDTPEEVAKAAAIVRLQKIKNEGEKEFPGDKSKFYATDAAIKARAAGGGGELTVADYDMLTPYVYNKGVTKKGLFGITKPKTIIYKKDIDPKDYEFMIGEDVIPYKDENKQQYFIVDSESGDWEAQNATISKSSVARRNMDRTSMSEVNRGALGTGFKPSVPVKTKGKRPPLSSFNKK